MESLAVEKGKGKKQIFHLQCRCPRRYRSRGACERLTLGPSSAADLGVVGSSSARGSTLGAEPNHQLDVGFTHTGQNPG